MPDTLSITMPAAPPERPEAVQPYLNVQGLSKSFGELQVLDGISFSVQKGRCLALLGASGCGKSTLLNIVAGLLPADKGRIELEGKVIEDASAGVSLPPQQRRLAVVFQDLSLWPHMTVFQNVAFGLENQRKLSKKEVQARVEEALERTAIHDLRYRYPATLSGGQQQRVAIARAIVVEPSVLLMDEPLAALDTSLRESMRDEIAGLIRRLDATTIYVTHDHSEAMTIAHEVAVMNAGGIEQLAPPREIYDFPRTTFVASFLGSANFFRYTYELEAMRHPSGESVFPPHPSRIKRGYLMVRREYVRIFAAAQTEEFPRGELIQWSATCVKNSFYGERYETHALTRKGELFRGFSLEPLPIDSSVVVEFDPKNVIFAER